MTKQTLDQKIADYEARLRRLKKRREQAETGQKIITGAVVINAARNDPKTREWLRGLIEERVTRVRDRERVQPLYDELRKADGLVRCRLRGDDDQGETPEPVNAGTDDPALSELEVGDGANFDPLEPAK